MGPGKGVGVGQGPDQDQAQLPSPGLPLAIGMEGNTVDRSKVTLDSSKLFLKGQMEEPGEKRVVIWGTLLSTSFQNSLEVPLPSTNYKVGNLGYGE